ncbi:hypothetical protein [Desulfobacter postgatei]|uniref:hypothetical protein n=1 Tax=Desulfobacter postgatei TaxID=2293 RepID=UPI002A364AF1|nr:hypothetical protein [Desulfobacter postgatei]MDX9964477.1 hypothetical protein [Desulfobacter postgatei]
MGGKVLAVTLILGRAEIPMDKGGALIYRRGKALPQRYGLPKAINSRILKIDDYNAAGRFIQELEILVLFGFLMPERVTNQHKSNRKLRASLIDIKKKL